VGVRAGMNVLGTGKISLPCLELNSRSSSPQASHCTGCCPGSALVNFVFMYVHEA
jgi:hypothetical protein